MSASAIPVLVVGTGFGCRIQIPALRAAGFEVVGLVGTDAARTKQRADLNGIAQAFTNLDDAITRSGAKAVAIASPPYTHAALTLAAVARGCHVLCEKPFAKDAAEARTMLQAAERAGVAHVIGNEFRWVPERAMAARLIAEGAIGEPRLITLTQFIQYSSAPDVNLPEWWFDPKSGGGWLGAWGSHVVDWVRSWLGEFSSLSAALPMVSGPAGGAEDTYVVRFRLANGTEGVLQQTSGAWGGWAAMVRVSGTKGSLWIENGALGFADAAGIRDVPIAPDLVLPPPPHAGDDPRQQTTEWQMLTHLELAPYVKLCEAWRALIEGKTPPGAVKPATFADGVACMEVLDAVRASAAKEGALVKLAQTI